MGIGAYLVPFIPDAKVIDVVSPVLDLGYFFSVIIWGAVKVFGAYPDWTSDKTMSDTGNYCPKLPFMWAFGTCIGNLVITPLAAIFMTVFAIYKKAKKHDVENQQ